MKPIIHEKRPEPAYICQSNSSCHEIAVNQKKGWDFRLTAANGTHIGFEL